jgi:hypothetical protein
MKSVLFLSAATLLFAAEIHSPQSSGLTVHEWGTFTSVAGEDGSPTDWDALGCKNDLPGFVHDFGYRGFKWRLPGTVRMETPVLYFYSSREVDAHVKVAFPQGVITEWYPRAEQAVYQKRVDGSVSRLEANLNWIDTSMRSLTGGIEWKNIQVQPDAAPVLPLESGPSRYYAARATDAAPIAVGDQHEKFLFYRGVGRFPVPLSARVEGDGRIVVENRGGDAVSNVILFENRGGRLRYWNLGALDGGRTARPPAPRPVAMAQLRDDLEKSLVAQGLFPKEARAMVETWRDSWFEEGSRLIYLVPARAIDAILPLQVEPAPSQTARVFVGRIELITPETSRSVEEAIATSDWSTIDRYVRFLDPILMRIRSEHPSKASQIEQFRRSRQARVGAGCR